LKIDYKYLILLFFTLIFSDVKSCNCNEGGSIGDNVVKSDFVIRAKILSFSYTNRLDTLGAKIIGDPRSTFSKYWNFNVKVYKAEVLKAYKGYVSKDTVLIVTGINRASCGIDFTLGSDYLIYGFEKDYMGFSNIQRIATNGRLFWTNTCTRSWYFSNEEEQEVIVEVEKNSYK
jgi:hypothetical protein